MKVFTFNEMENMLEIGRSIQRLIDDDIIKVVYYDDRELFLDAMNWAIEFENQYMDSGNYYFDIDMFTRKKLREKGLME
jgi:hypothetical protein